MLFKKNKTDQNRIEQLERKLEQHQQLQWHMQYYYDKQLAQIENARIEALCPGNHDRLTALKNQYKGKRCFIIGNGPSLKASDLDKLVDEYTFGCNRIDKIFNQTKWRPTFYCVTDRAYFNFLKEKSWQGKTVLCVSNAISALTQPNIENSIFFALNTMYRKKPEFTNDVSDIVYEGGTVTYVEIQMAAYMGFREIYLLGVDNTINKKVLPDGRIGIDLKGYHFTDNYYDSPETQEAEEAFLNAWIDYSNLEKSGVYNTTDSYQMANWYAGQNGIFIRNATRGGELEVFPRVDFDALF